MNAAGAVQGSEAGDSAGRRAFLFLLASTRRGGNTEQLARAAATAIPAGVEQRWIRLTDEVLPAFTDIRHEGEGVYPQPAGAERVLLEATLAATDVVIATPMYWYSITASAKLYLDYWSAWMRVPGVDFAARMAGKTLWGVTAHTTEQPAPGRAAGGDAPVLGRVHGDAVGRGAARVRQPARRDVGRRRGAGPGRHVLRCE